MRDSYTLYQDKLEGNYKEVFKQIDTYFGTEKVDEDTREEYMGELLDVFLLAQEEGRPVEKITGNNIESFCKTFCSNLTWKQKVLSIIDLGRGFAHTAFICSLLTLIPAFMDMLSGEKTSIWEIRSSINIFGYLCGFILVIITSYMFSWVTRRIMFKAKKVSIKVWDTVVGVFAVLIALLMLWLGFSDKLDSFFDFPAWMVCVGSSIYLLIYRICNRHRIKERKEHEVSFWAEVKNGMEFDPNSDNIFSQDMEKKWAYWVFPIVITVGFVMFGAFETQTDMFWFAGITLVVTYLLMALLWKGAESQNVNIRKWIAHERKKLEQAVTEENNDAR